MFLIRVTNSYQAPCATRGAASVLADRHLSSSTCNPVYSTDIAKTTPFVGRRKYHGSISRDKRLPGGGDSKFSEGDSGSHLRSASNIESVEPRKIVSFFMRDVLNTLLEERFCCSVCPPAFLPTKVNLLFLPPPIPLRRCFSCLPAVQAGGRGKGAVAGWVRVRPQNEKGCFSCCHASAPHYSIPHKTKSSAAFHYRWITA